MDIHVSGHQHLKQITQRFNAHGFAIHLRNFKGDMNKVPPGIEG